MYKFKYLLLVVIFLFSCKSKKELIQKESYVETVNTNTLDSVIVKNKLIKPDSFKFQMELDLNKLDIFKQLFSEQRPSVLTDSTGQARVYTWIDKDNNLKQRVIIKPKDILTGDTTKIRSVEKNTNINKTKEIKETITIDKSKVGFFGKVWAFIQNFGWFIIVSICLVIGYKIWNLFNIGDIIKNLIK